MVRRPQRKLPEWAAAAAPESTHPPPPPFIFPSFPRSWGGLAALCPCPTLRKQTPLFALKQVSWRRPLGCLIYPGHREPQLCFVKVVTETHCTTTPCYQPCTPHLLLQLMWDGQDKGLPSASTAQVLPWPDMPQCGRHRWVTHV